jgi:hypothetical protein
MIGQVITCGDRSKHRPNPIGLAGWFQLTVHASQSRRIYDSRKSAIAAFDEFLNRQGVAVRRQLTNPCAKRMRDFVALISASRPEVTIHLVDGDSVTGAAVLPVWNEGGRLLVYSGKRR